MCPISCNNIDNISLGVISIIELNILESISIEYSLNLIDLSSWSIASTNSLFTIGYTHTKE